MKTIIRNSKFLYLLIFFITISGCNAMRSYSIKNQITNYTGDGTIKYIPGTFLGCPGVELKFESISLTQKFSQLYQLVNLPVTKRTYWIIFNIQPPPTIKYSDFGRELNTKATLRMKLLINSKTNSTVLFDCHAPLSSELWFWGGSSAFYFNQLSELPNNTSGFEVTNDKNSYTLYVEYDPNGTPVGTSGYFSVSSGGYK